MNRTSSPTRMLKAFWFFALCFGVNLNVVQATDLKQTRQMAERGDAKAQYTLARMYENGTGVRENLSKAVTWYRQAAEKGFAPAQYGLGRIYAAGSGMPQDYSEALRWLRKAAAQDYAPAQNRLGVMYQDGQGLPQDDVEAYKWFTLAAREKQNIYGMANRENLARRMTTEQLAEGKRRATSSRELLVANSD